MEILDIEEMNLSKVFERSAFLASSHFEESADKCDLPSIHLPISKQFIHQHMSLCSSLTWNLWLRKDSPVGPWLPKHTKYPSSLFSLVTAHLTPSVAAVKMQRRASRKGMRNRQTCHTCPAPSHLPRHTQEGLTLETGLSDLTRVNYRDVSLAGKATSTFFFKKVNVKPVHSGNCFGAWNYFEQESIHRPGRVHRDAR